jgi:hypothetical protein
MACCIIAAYLYALLRAKLRQWAVYWGLAKRRPGDDQVTAWTRVALTFRGRREPSASPLLPRA